MASLAAAAVSVQPVAAKGLAGRKLAVVRPSSRAVCRSTRKYVVRPVVLVFLR
jgi:hypothetical protein